MNLNVSQKNLYLFLPSKISWLAEMLSREKGLASLMPSKRFMLLIYIAI